MGNGKGFVLLFCPDRPVFLLNELLIILVFPFVGGTGKIKGLAYTLI